MLTVIWDNTIAVFEASKAYLLEPVFEVGVAVGGARGASRIEDGILVADPPLATAVAVRHTATQDHCRSVTMAG